MELSDGPVAAASGVGRLTVIVRDAASGKWRLFERPVEVVVARHIEDVLPAIERIENACVRHQMYAAGFVSYEAAPAFDSALKTQPPDDFPLLWFGVYDAPHERTLDELGPRRAASPTNAGRHRSRPSNTRRVFEQLQELIRNGDTYQVNYTYRMRTRLRSDPFALFLRLAASQSPPFGAFLDTGEWAICSASPELFFHRSGARVESRPMKGTAARGLWFEQDLEQAKRLRESEKERSENVMIVDMVRNDLGRVARPGSVRVDEPVRRRAVSERAAIDVDGRRRDGCRARRPHARAVSRGVHYRSAEGADDGDYRGRGVFSAAYLYRHDRLRRTRRSIAIQRGHPDGAGESCDGRGGVRCGRRNRRRFEASRRVEREPD